jgi:hypothetical protein
MNTTEPKLLKLKTQLRKDGWDLNQVWREGNIAIYHQTKPGYKVEAYEVVRIRTSKPFPGTLIEYDLREVYPAFRILGCTWVYLQNPSTSRR